MNKYYIITYSFENIRGSIYVESKSLYSALESLDDYLKKMEKFKGNRVIENISKIDKKSFEYLFNKAED